VVNDVSLNGEFHEILVFFFISLYKLYIPAGRFFVPDVPTLALHGLNSNSAGIYQILDKELSGRMFILPGISSSEKRNPLEESDSAGNYCSFTLIKTGLIEMRGKSSER
jgi:hypothetical protein